MAVRGVEDRPDLFHNLLAHFPSGNKSASFLLHEELAALPGYPAKDGELRGFQSRVVITGDELDAIETMHHQALQEGQPVDFMLNQGDRDAQDLSLAIQASSHSDQDGGIPDLTILAHFLVVGIQENPGELSQWSIAPGF